MKTIVLFTLLIFGATTTWSTVRTVSNDATRPAQFNGTGNTGFNNAQTASAAGDTLYVYGSPFSYGTITISKRLVVIGAGYGPNNQFGQPTRVDAMQLFRDGSTDPSGAVICGILCSGSLSQTGTLATNNITIFRNRIGSYIYTYNSSNYSTNWTIFNNIFFQVIGPSNGRTSPSPTNIIVANNIITGSVSNLNSNTILIDHNIFLGQGNFYHMWNAIISNNVFTRSSGTLFNGEIVFNTFNKNISNQNTIGTVSQYSPSNVFEATWLSTGGGSNSGAGNMVGTNPLYQSVTNFDTYDINADYRLQSGSPGKNQATDGTDIGIYGGSYPFPSGGTSGSGFDTSPMPPIPQVTAVNIQNATIQPNGTLNVQVQGRINN